MNEFEWEKEERNNKKRKRVGKILCGYYERVFQMRKGKGLRKGENIIRMS